MITARLRHRLQSGFVAHVRRHSKWYPISPNVLTFGALVLAIPACWAIAERHYLLAVSFILASGAIDFIDGCVARGLERTTKFGSYWDAMIDRYVDCLLYLGFVLDGYELGQRRVPCSRAMPNRARRWSSPSTRRTGRQLANGPNDSCYCWQVCCWPTGCPPSVGGRRSVLCYGQQR